MAQKLRPVLAAVVVSLIREPGPVAAPIEKMYFINSSVFSKLCNAAEDASSVAIAENK